VDAHSLRKLWEKRDVPGGLAFDQLTSNTATSRTDHQGPPQEKLQQSIPSQICMQNHS